MKKLVISAHFFASFEVAMLAGHTWELRTGVAFGLFLMVWGSLGVVLDEMGAL